MSAENPISYEHINFSIDPEVVTMAKKLLGDIQIEKKAAKKWIQSPAKEALERAVFGVIGSVVTSPIVLATRGGVSITDKGESLYHFQVGFLGKDNRIVSLTNIAKIRSMQRGVDKRDIKNPLYTTAFMGGRDRPFLTRDPRVFGDFGMWVRRIGIDELPQLQAVLMGQMAGVGPRAYTIPELRGLEMLFKIHDNIQSIFPDTLPPEYRDIISDIIPKPGFFGLYTAILRKRLTISERLLLDHLYLTCANPAGDLRIVKATFKTIIRGIGAS